MRLLFWEVEEVFHRKSQLSIMTDPREEAEDRDWRVVSTKEIEVGL